MNKSKLAGLLVALMSLAGSANAQTSTTDGFYAGLGMLESKSDTGYVVDSRLRGGTSNGTNPLLTAGYRRTYGDFEYGRFVLAGEVRYTNQYGDELKASVPELSINPGWQINDSLSVFARFGVLRLKSEALGLGSAEADATVQGIGVDYRIKDNWLVRVESQTVKGSKSTIAGTEVKAPEANSYGVSVLYRF